MRWRLEKWRAELGFSNTEALHWKKPAKTNMTIQPSGEVRGNGCDLILEVDE
jgi:hypothetical protein